MLPEGGHPRTSMTWDYRSVAMLPKGTCQDFHDLGLQECGYVTRGDIQGLPWPGTSGVWLCYLRGHARTSMTWDYRSVAMLPEGTSKDFHDLGLQECGYVTRGGMPGLPWPGTTGVWLCYQWGRARTSMTWDYRSVGMLPEGTSKDFHDLGLQECSQVIPKGTSKDIIYSVLGVREYTHATRGDIWGSPGTSKNFSHLRLK